MAVDTPATIAILGAGPIGLEAALYARFLGYDVHVYERARIGEHVARWGHVRMFSPFGMNTSSLGRAALHAHDPRTRLPPADQCVTGRQWLEDYLLPLAQTDLLADHIEVQCEVQSVSRWRMNKGEGVGDEARGEDPFRILVRDAQGRERADTADIVIDASGVYHCPRNLGPGGAPALGETALRDRIDYHLPDVAGTDRDRFAGQRILLVGSGYSAATTVVAWESLARKEPGTSVVWITRAVSSEGQGPVPRIEGDRLAERGALAEHANALAAGASPHVLHWPNRQVHSLRLDGERFEVTLADTSDAECPPERQPTCTETFDRIIAHVGFAVDASLFRELHVHQCYATEGPMKLAAALLDQGAPDSLAVRAPGPDVLLTPEPNFYLLGSKSYGRNSKFLYLFGLQQIRDLFSIIGDRADLNLYANAAKLPQ